jgi:hypothetical protein
MWKRVLILIVVVLGLLPAAVAAQGPGDEDSDDVLIRIDGAIHVRAGETAQSVVVISDNALIEGTVEYLVVIDGDATITGTVENQVYIVNGTVTLKDGARVGEEVLLYNADAVEEAGATVVGGVHEEWGGFNVTRGVWFGFWLSMTVTVVGAGLLFAAFGGGQLRGAAGIMTGEVGPTVLTALIVWIAIPIVAVLAMVTLVGIPFGIGVLVFLLPATWFLGYLVAGTAVGALIVKAKTAGGAEHPYLPVLVGLLVFQVIALVPFIGGTIAFFAGLVGAGALVYRAWLGFRGTTARRAATTPTIPAAPTM